MIDETQDRGDFENSFYRDLGIRLRKQRKLMVLSREELGKKVGAHRNTIERWENGTASICLWDFLRLCDQLNIFPHTKILPTDALRIGAMILQLEHERDPEAGYAVQSDKPLTKQERRTYGV